MRGSSSLVYARRIARLATGRMFAIQIVSTLVVPLGAQPARDSGQSYGVSQETTTHKGEPQ